MVVNLIILLSSMASVTSVNCTLCSYALSLSVFSSLTISCFLPHLCFVWASYETCQRRYLYYGFNEPLVPSYFPLLSFAISSWRD
jgi:hypothetical protein